MFATQHYMDTMSDAGRKRQLDDPDFGPGSTSFAEHRNKRVQCLPLRTSSSTQPEQWPPTTNLSPRDTDMGEQIPQQQPSTWADAGFEQSQQCPETATDSMHTNTQHSPALEEIPRNTAEPNQTQSNPRMPTPIQPNFELQLRGQHQHWSETAGQNGLNNLGHQQTGLDNGISGRGDWQSHQQSRRLPSPIYETVDGTPQMPLGETDENAELSYRLQTSSLTASHQQCMEHPNTMMDADNLRLAVPTEEEGEPSSPSPPRKGHQRSLHTVNSWTWQPGMKRSFSIGYRSDCEKCRDKVPGHFNHIIIS